MISTSQLKNMINKSRLLKLSLLPILSIGVISVSLSLGLREDIKDEKVISNVIIPKPTEKGVVKFVVGSITSSPVTPLQCEGTTKHLLFGKFFNTTNRIVGLRSQDTTITLTTSNTNYNIKPFTDECVSYVSKQDYLFPNTSTKGYFEIVDNAESASNLVIDAANSIELDFKTNEATDKKVKDRLELETSVDVQRQEIEDTTKPAFVVQEVPTESPKNVERTVIGSLIFLALCPISIMVGHLVYRTKKKKKD